MPRKVDFINVIDIEATCWPARPPQGQESDIIEIGLCPLEVATGRSLERRSILVRPERSDVSPFCTQLTTLTQEMVEGGIEFSAACDILRNEYDGRERVWASWGDYDRHMFEKQCVELRVQYPFGGRHLNIKTLFSLLRGHTFEMGVAKALEKMGWEFEGTAHRAGDDAWNIARLLAGLLGRETSKIS